MVKCRSLVKQQLYSNLSDFGWHYCCSQNLLNSFSVHNKQKCYIYITSSAGLAPLHTSIIHSHQHAAGGLRPINNGNIVFIFILAHCRGSGDNWTKSRYWKAVQTPQKINIYQSSHHAKSLEFDCHLWIVANLNSNALPFVIYFLNFNQTGSRYISAVQSVAMHIYCHIKTCFWIWWFIMNNFSTFQHRPNQPQRSMITQSARSFHW